MSNPYHAHARRGPLSAWALAAAVALAGASGCKSSRRVDLPPSQRSVALAIEKARQAQQSKDPERAAVLYREAVEIYPEFAAAWNNLGNLYMGQQAYLDAAEAFARAAEHAPSDPRPLYNLGLTWDRAGWLPDSLRFYKQALVRDPRYLPALRGAIRAERLLQITEPGTLERLKVALGQETDEKWRTYFTFQRSNVEQELYKGLAQPPGASELPSTVPSGGMYPVTDMLTPPATQTRP